MGFSAHHAGDQAAVYSGGSEPARRALRGKPCARCADSVVGVPEAIDRDLQYHVLPDDPPAALNVLRQAAGLEPLPSDDGDSGVRVRARNVEAGRRAVPARPLPRAHALVREVEDRRDVIGTLRRKAARRARVDRERHTP